MSEELFYMFLLVLVVIVIEIIHKSLQSIRKCFESVNPMGLRLDLKKAKKI